MSWRSASTSTSQPELARGGAGHRPDRDHARAVRARAPPRLEEEADRGAGGEGHVVGALERSTSSLAERLGHRVVERPRRPPARRARAARRAARRAPRPPARPAPRWPSTGTSTSASTSASAIERAGTTSAAMPAPRAARPPCPGRWRPPWRRRARARRAPPAASASNSSRTPLGLVKQTRAYSRIARHAPRRSSPSTGRGSIRIAGVSTTSAPSSREPRGQPAGLRARAGDRHHPAVQRPALEPGQRVAQAGRAARPP